LPPGFKIEVLVGNVTDARQMALTPDETWLFVGTRKSKDSKTYAINLKTRKLFTLANGLQMSNGVAYDASTDTLYVAEVKRISKIPNIVQRLNQGETLPLQLTPVRDYPVRKIPLLTV
jgi:DNA-binding beta-propeller fold protein YncE